jgi:phosphohistidine phosphatase SixA
MKCVSTLYRRLATTAIVLASITSITLVMQARGDLSETNSSHAEGSQLGFLTLGLPHMEKRPACTICTRTREQASDYAPVPHFLGGPKRILLMRHADKTDDAQDEDLSEAGQARAEHLATYIPQTFGNPDFIIASAHSKHSNRSKETVEPLAHALGMKVQHDLEKDEFEDLVEEIFNNPDYKGKTVVICWHHGKLPAIAALLGAPAGSYPDPWPDDAYNLILDLQYDPNSGSVPTVNRVIEPF